MHTIDASGRTIGRVATEAAVLLRGKQLPSFERHLAPAVRVLVVNAGKLRISEKRMKQKIYRRYTGYPGGLKEQTLEALMTKKGPGEALKLAITRMLPRNRLRPGILKNLDITL